MIHPNWQGGGWGTKITKYRIEQIKQTTAHNNKPTYVSAHLEIL